MTKAVEVTKTYTAPPAPPAMTGWKTKAGAIMVAIGGTISGSSKLAPYPDMEPWLEFIGFIIAGVGGAFTVWGIGHKLEKNNAVINVNARVVPTNSPTPPNQAGVIR